MRGVCDLSNSEELGRGGGSSSVKYEGCIDCICKECKNETDCPLSTDKIKERPCSKCHGRIIDWCLNSKYLKRLEVDQ